MNNVHPLIRVGGPILGVLILVYVIYIGVNAFQANLRERQEAERAATLAASQPEDEPAAEADEAQPEDEPTTEADEATAETDEPEAEPVAQRVFFRQPTNNAIIPPTSVVKMGAEGLVVQPSGEINPGAGHMHILVNTDFVPAGQVIITDEQHLHFGDGSLEAELILPPGEHTLRLQFADGAHIALEGEQFQDEITVLVEENTASPAVRFVQPADGETISSPLEVVMAATGLVVEPSGEINPGAGHMHILVNTDFVPAGQVIITDEQHLHFGDGSLETELILPPGEHTLRLQFADGAHIALEGEQFQDEITVLVEENTASPAVRFVQPADGETISSPLEVVMAATGLVVEPSGEINPGAGHMHILVNTDFVPAGQVIITDEQHLHFGDGSLETELTLPPGEHILRLQFADGAHIALEGEQFQDEITVLVEENAASPAVRFVQPTNNAIIPPTSVVKMGAEGLVVEPSGEINPGAGHMHILVNTDFVPAGQVIITDEQHLHFGDGSLETELTLPPGEHILRLQFADGAHIALEGEQFQDEITVLVEENAASPAVRFVQPADGETISSPLEVVMAATGLVVEPSGEIRPGAGHFHILVNTDFVPAGQVIITDEQHLHFGDGSLETELTLPPGEHTLRLQFADGAHIALEGDAYRDMIVITVTDSASNLPQETVDLAISAMIKTGCNTCHITPGLPEPASNLGPDQTNMGVVASSRIEGYTAEEYIRESILMPNAFIVPECPTGPCLEIMPANLDSSLTEEELDAVVAYLLTLGF